MSDLKRAYDLLRGYVGREWDRIKDIEWSEAAKELLVPEGKPATPPEPTAPAAEAAPKPVTDFEAQAREILGVRPEDDFAALRKAYERLTKRTDPALFPAGTPEADQAAKLRAKVDWAYQFLTASTDATAKRFGSLEIEG